MLEDEYAVISKTTLLPIVYQFDYLTLAFCLKPYSLYYHKNRVISSVFLREPPPIKKPLTSGYR